MIGDQVGSFDFAEIRFDLLEHFHAPRVTLVAGCGLRILWLDFRVLQNKRIVIDSQKTGPAGIGATTANADKAGQIEAACTDLLSDVRAKRRKLYPTHRQIAVMQQERCSRM